MTYNILAGDRKEVVKKLSELTGKKVSYTGAPKFTYELDGISITNRGVVETEEADENIVRQLVEAGLIEAAEADGADSEPEASTSAQEAPVTDSEDEGEEVPADADEAPQNGAEEEQEEENADADEGSGTTETEGTIVSYSFPLSDHTAKSIRNLIYTIYSKGDLLSKASGGDFFVSEALVWKLKEKDPEDRDGTLEIVKNAPSGDLRGITFTDDQVTFTGFPEMDSPDVIRAWMTFAAMVNKAALKRERVQAKRNEETNEKFAFRTWLTRLGMNGADLKEARQIYYRNLTGHTAFKTPADAEKWKAARARRKAERKAAEAAQESTETTAEA